MILLLESKCFSLFSLTITEYLRLDNMLKKKRGLFWLVVLEDGKSKIE
jgi:hypothetical protein